MNTKKKAMLAFCIVIIIAGVLLLVKFNHDKADVPDGGIVTEQDQEQEQDDLEEPSVVEQQSDEQQEESPSAQNEGQEEVYEGDVVGRKFQAQDTTIEFLDKSRMVISIQSGGSVIDSMYRYALSGDRIEMEKDGIEYTYSFSRTRKGIKLDGTTYELIGSGDSGGGDDQ